LVHAVNESAQPLKRGLPSFLAFREQRLDEQAGHCGINDDLWQVLLQIAEQGISVFA
jgi:hypothetical protein